MNSIFFQGEKNDGFNVLYQNMKGGITAARELGDFLRERAKLEEDNSKARNHSRFFIRVGYKTIYTSRVGFVYGAAEINTRPVPGL